MAVSPWGRPGPQTVANTAADEGSHVVIKGPRFPYTGCLKSTDAIPEYFGPVKDKKKENEATLVENREKTNGDNVSAESGGTAPADEAATKGHGDDWLIWECFVKAVGEPWSSGEPGKAALEIAFTHAMLLPRREILIWHWSSFRQYFMTSMTGLGAHQLF